MPKMGWLSRLKRRPPTREPSGPEIQRVHRMIRKQKSASPPFLLHSSFSDTAIVCQFLVYSYGNKVQRQT